MHLTSMKYGVFLSLTVACGLSCAKKMSPGRTMTVTPAGANSNLDTRTYHQGDYSLTFTNNDPAFDTSIRTKLVQTFFEVYPREVKRFNPGVAKHITFSMDTAYHGVAATGGGRTTFSAAYYHAHPGDIDVVTHEVMHIVQGYPRYNPVWLVEGIADYVRYVYGVHNKEAGWVLYNYSSRQSYKNSYRITARFLLWVERHQDKKIVDQLDASLRKNTYTADTWKQLTGKTVDELWTLYGQDPSLSLHYN